MQSCRLIIRHLAAPRRPAERPLAEDGGLCAAGSMLIAVASLCQSVSVLSALVLHSITHSLVHWLTHSIAHSLTHCSSQTGRQSHLSCKTTTLPPFGRTNPSPGQDDVPLEKRLHRTISDTHPVSLIYKSSLGEKKEGFLVFLSQETVDKGWRLMYFCSAWLGYISDWITATQSLLPRHSHFTSAGDSQWNSACGRDGAGPESRGEGNYPLWSLGDDMSLCDSFCYFDRRGKRVEAKKGWLKECLPSLCLWRKKYGDTRVVSKDVPWQQSGRKSRERNGHVRKECPEGVSARCLRPLQPLLPHFVAWRHLEKMQMSRKQRDCMIV